MWRSAARSIGACLALLCFFAVSSADPSPPSRADVTSGVRVAQRLIDTIPSPWRLDGDVRMAGDDAPVAQGNFVQASYALNKASLDSIATFSRAGTAMQFDSQGYLTYGPNNLLTYSNTFSNAAWTLSTATLTSGISDPDGGTSAWTLTATGAGALLYQNVTVPSTANGLFAVWVKRRTGSGTISLRQPAGAYTPITVTGSWALASIVGLGNGAINIAIQIATSGDAIDIYKAALSAVTYETTPRSQDQVITTSAAYYGPRFDYTYNGSSWVPAGLLVEGAATNLALNSNNLAAATWAKASLALSTDGTLGPDGAAISKITTSSGVITGQIYPGTPLTITSGSPSAQSWIVKKGNLNFVSLLLQVSTNNWAVAVFDISGTADITASQTAVGVTSGAVVSATGKYLGSGLYRLSLVATITGTTAWPIIQYPSAAAGNTFDTGGNLASMAAANSTSYAGYVQHELGSFASSYTPTGASAVTRAADGVTFTGYTSNPFAILSAPESTGSYACNKYASQAAAISGVASPNQWVKSVKVWPVGTPSASQSC